MGAGSHDFECEQGSTFRHVINYADANDVAINLANYKARMQVRYARSGEADLVVQLNETNGRAVVTDAAAGEITLIIDSAATAALVGGNYYYDLEIYSADNPPAVERLLEGRFLVDPEVTV
jgi:hypothetical protein